MEKNNYYHRDIKPDNIVGKPDGNKYDIRFIDWGLAKKGEKWTNMRQDLYFVKSLYFQCFMSECLLKCHLCALKENKSINSKFLGFSV